uniref:NADH dehydrogenase [ubiquinone] 1 beta subcomplex subunit 5, mitochondrial n=1 Tax=Daphnia hispanica TaxID=575233 RepID=A0A4Y7M2Z4_9CRUS|nr:EOG090X0FIE [Daphnia hispanica]
MEKFAGSIETSGDNIWRFPKTAPPPIPLPGWDPLPYNTNLPKYAINHGILVLRPNTNNALQAIRQMSDHRTMHIKPSRWSWNRFKDLMHFYIMLGVIPATIVITYVNVFIGPAQLVEIPEGYVPEPHEYFPHPITRWMSKYVSRSYQQEYEFMCHHIYETEYEQKLRKAEKRIKQKMAEKQDTQAYYYEPVTSRYERSIRDNAQTTLEVSGTN